jgi:hypothetical protein
LNSLTEALFIQAIAASAVSRNACHSEFCRRLMVFWQTLMSGYSEKSPPLLSLLRDAASFLCNGYAIISAINHFSRQFQPLSRELRPTSAGRRMAFFRRAAYTNPLTEQIQATPNIALIDVLLHPDLGSAVKNEASVLTDYLVDPAIRPARIVTLTEWALSDKWQEAAATVRDKLPTTRLQQPSRNAALVLWAPSRSIWERLEEPAHRATRDEVVKLVQAFIQDKKRQKHPIYAGHFQRILEAFLRRGEDWVPPGPGRKPFYDAVIAAAHRHVRVLAYQQLLTQFALDFPFVLCESYGNPDSEPAVKSHMLDILRTAVTQAMYVEEYSRAQVPELSAQTMTEGTKAGIERARRAQQQKMRVQSALSQSGKPLLSPHRGHGQPCARPYASTSGYRQRLMQNCRRLNIQRSPKLAEQSTGKTKSPLKRYENAQARVYLLLLSIQAMLVERPDLLRLMQEFPVGEPDAAGPTILECLLAIGVYSDCDSPIAPLAFRLVRRIAHGYGDFGTQTDTGEDAALWKELIPASDEDLPSSKPCFGEPFYTKMVDIYAQDFQFAFPVTNQMAAGFAIFWKRPCKFLNPAVIFEDQRLTSSQFRLDPVVPIFDTNGNPTEERYPPPIRDKPRTRGSFSPLELYGHFVFFDPPHRDDLNLTILLVLHWYHQTSMERRNKEFDQNDPKAYAEYQKELYECDLLFYNLVTAKFSLGEDILDMTALDRALPMHPTDPRMNDRPRGTVRAPLNGASAAFAFFWLHSDFYTEALGRSALGDAHGATITDAMYAPIEAYCSLMKVTMTCGDCSDAYPVKQADTRSKPSTDRGEMIDRNEPPPEKRNLLFESQGMPPKWRK